MRMLRQAAVNIGMLQSTGQIKAKDLKDFAVPNVLCVPCARRDGCLRTMAYPATFKGTCEDCGKQDVQVALRGTHLCTPEPAGRPVKIIDGQTGETIYDVLEVGK